MLTGNRIGSEGCAALGRTLPGLPMLKKLAIDACFLDDAAASAFSAAWPRAPGGRPQPCEIERVALGGNALSAPGIAALAQCFACCRKLEEVDVSCTPLAAELPPHIVATGPGDASQYDTFAWLDHSAAAAAVGGGPAPRQMFVWGPEMVQALSPLLRTTHCVRGHGCVWTPAALRELLSFVNCNPSLRLLALRQNERRGEVGAAAAPADVTLSHVFRNLHARSETTAGAAAMLSLDVAGLAPGGMGRVEREAQSVVQSIANLNLGCPEVKPSSQAAPNQVHIDPHTTSPLRHFSPPQKPVCAHGLLPFSCAQMLPRSYPAIEVRLRPCAPYGTSSCW